MGYDITLLLDGLILVFLCVTIFYAARLSLFMKSFRQGRSEMQRLIDDLMVTIDKAESSIAMMKKNAIDVEGEIREVINESKFLSDELRFMNETGDGLANRLEKLADRNRELVDLMENSGGIGTQKITPYEPSAPKKSVPKPPIEETFEIDDFDLDASTMDEDDEFDFMALGDGAYREEEALGEVEEDLHQPVVNTAAKSKVRSFAIFDREYEDDLEDDFEFEQSSSSENEMEFHSRAEQDLYEALQRKKQAYDEAHGSRDLPPQKKTKVSKLS